MNQEPDRLGGYAEFVIVSGHDEVAELFTGEKSAGKVDRIE